MLNSLLESFNNRNHSLLLHFLHVSANAMSTKLEPKAITLINAMASINGLVELFMKANGSLIRRMVKEFIGMLVVIYT